jgi:hypothetical protein
MLERCHGTYSPNINIHIAEDFPKLPTSTLCTPGMHAISAWLTCMPNLALSQDLPVPSVFLPGIPPHPSGRARSLRCRFWCTVQNAAIDAVTPKPPHKLPTCIDWTPTAKTHPEPPWTALICLSTPSACLGPSFRPMLLLIAALLCTGLAAGADSQSALDAWPSLKYGYSLPSKVRLCTLHSSLTARSLLYNLFWGNPSAGSNYSPLDPSSRPLSCQHFGTGLDQKDADVLVLSRACD